MGVWCGALSEENVLLNRSRDGQTLHVEVLS